MVCSQRYFSISFVLTFYITVLSMTNRIKIERAVKEITQAQLAEMVGATRQTINAIEKNKYNPSALLAYKISRAFDKTIEEVFDFSDEK